MTAPRVSELWQRTERKWAPPTPLGNCRHCGLPVALDVWGMVAHAGWPSRRQPLHLRDTVGPAFCGGSPAEAEVAA